MRLSRKARVICSSAPARAPAGTREASGGSRRPSSASRRSPDAPPGSTRSMRDRRPTLPVSSWAVAISVTRSDSSPRRPKSSPASRSPARVNRRRLPATTTSKLSPGWSPQRCALCRKRRALAGLVSSVASTLPFWNCELKERMGGSAKGSMPTSCRVVPARPTRRASAASTGAQPRKWCSTRISR